MRSKQGQISKTYRFCDYCSKRGHDDSNCPDKKSGKPPSKPEWTKTIRCHSCRQVGHLAFDCPPKYKCAVARTTISTQKQTLSKTPTPSQKQPHSEPSSTPSEPHFAGSAHVHFAHAATVAYHQDTGAIFFNLLHQLKYTGLTVIYKFLLLTIAVLHSFIFFTLCKTHPDAKRDFYKHQHERVSASMIKDLAQALAHLIFITTKFIITIISSFAHHYVRDATPCTRRSTSH